MAPKIPGLKSSIFSILPHLRNQQSSFPKPFSSSFSNLFEFRNGMLNFDAKNYSSTEENNVALKSECIFEMRTYTLKPELFNDYNSITQKFADLRKSLNPGWLGFWCTETGGTLNTVKHLYLFEGWEQREQVRKNLANHPVWSKAYIPTIRPMLEKQESMIMMEATDCMQACGISSVRHVSFPCSDNQSPVYELRTYHLEAGYHSVPNLIKHFCQGLPSRVASEGCGKCVFMAYSDVGLLNVFIELWRHDSTVACINARKGARKAEEWRKTIAGVAPLTKSFQSEILRPLPFSPLQ